MTSSAILKAINTLPVAERMKIIEQVIRSIRLEKPKENRENPSPSGDPWFDDPRNIAIVKEGIKSAREENCVSVEESPILSAIFSKYR
jgi:hypothetical protein